VKQSGVYLTGALLAADASEKAAKAIEQHPPLTGQWNQQLSLAGPLTHLKGCEGTITVNGSISQDNKLDGTISLNSAESKNFTAQREKPKTAAQGH
jgi:autotransporter translocation and assembly factor TamB